MKQKSNSIIKQATILACAGLITKVIGLLYRGPLTNIIGNNGNGAYGTAYTIYALVLLISSYSIPMAVSKIMSAKLALKEYKNAHRIFVCAFFYVLIVGGIASILTFILAPCLKGLGKPNAILSLRIFAPTILLSGILGVFRGYFQAHNTMVPTSLSQILEQIMNAIGSVAFAYLFTRPFIHSSDKNDIYSYGAAGGALGTGIGVVSALLLCIGLYLYTKKKHDRIYPVSDDEPVDSYRHIFKVILLMVSPVILSTCIYNISGNLDMFFFYGILRHKGVSDHLSESMYGIFSGKYSVIINVPIALSSAMAASLISVVSAYFAKNKLTETREKIEQSIHFTMLFAFPSAVGIGVLAEPILNLIFHTKKQGIEFSNDLAANLLILGCVSIIFYSLSTVTNAVLQGIGQMRIPVINAIKALVIHLIVLIALLYFTELNLYTLVISAIVYSLLMCYLNQKSVAKCLGYKLNYTKLFVIPAIAACYMGVVTYIIYYTLDNFIRSNLIKLIPSILLSAIFYFGMLFKMRGITERELSTIGIGRSLLHIMRKCHFIR